MDKSLQPLQVNQGPRRKINKRLKWSFHPLIRGFGGLPEKLFIILSPSMLIFKGVSGQDISHFGDHFLLQKRFLGESETEFWTKTFFSHDFHFFLQHVSLTNVSASSILFFVNF